MTIRWSDLLRPKVQAVLRRHPAKSNRCDVAAREVLPLARELDDAARTISVRPIGRQRFVVPKANLDGAGWFMHFTVEVTAHCVDALTGVDGTEIERYLADHWQYPDFLALEPEALPDVV